MDLRAVCLVLCATGADDGVLCEEAPEVDVRPDPTVLESDAGALPESAISERHFKTMALVTSGGLACRLFCSEHGRGSR